MTSRGSTIVHRHTSSRKSTLGSPRPSLVPGDSEAISVGVRLRPLLPQEKGQKACIQIDGNEVRIVGNVEAKTRDFAFDAAMDSSDPNSPDYVSQEKCYELMGRRMKDHMMLGFNSCLFCYGQTGTGKTTTIMGKSSPLAEQGLLMRLLHDVFVDISQQRAEGSIVDMRVQMLEVYNEKLKDLIVPDKLKDSRDSTKIEVHVHPQLGCYLKGATTEVVDTFEDCMRLLEYGNTMKTMRATAMNKQSSRGHTVFRLNMERSGSSDAKTTSSEVYFVDLAGRENERTTQVTGDGRIELSFINKSLMFLATCIQSLGTDAAKSHSAGPKRLDMGKFRNSKLTLLLANALSGNSKTAMIGTLSPSLNNFEETVSTLKFASTVKTIRLQASAGVAVDKDVLVTQLKDEVNRLKEELEGSRQSKDVDRMQQLMSELEATKGLKEFYGKNMDMLRLETFANKGLRTETLKRLNIAPDGHEASLPYVANYSDDLFMAFRLVFHVPPDGKEYSAGTFESNNFQLPSGTGVCSVTAYFRHNDGKLWLRPAPLEFSEGRRSSMAVIGRKLANIQLNDEKVGEEPVELQHMDKIIFGRATVFFVFKTRPSSEDLAGLRVQMMAEEHADNKEDHLLIHKVLGEKRAANPAEVDTAQEYLERMRKRHRDCEGQVALRIFLHRLTHTDKLVDEASDITAELRPNSGLVMELSTQAPPMSFGYDVGMPECSVRLLRRSSAAKARWLYAVQHIRCQRKGLHCTMESLKSFGATSRSVDLSKGMTEVLAIWTWETFESRLEVMRDLYESHISDPSGFKLPLDDPDRDPWFVASVGHRKLRSKLTSANSMRTSAIASAADLEEKLQQALLQKQELERTVQLLQTQLGAQQGRTALSAAGRTAPPSAENAGAVQGFQKELQQCLALSQANQTMAEKLVQLRNASRVDRRAIRKEIRGLRPNDTVESLHSGYEV